MRRERILRKLTGIQRRAGAIIAGAFRTTAGPALDVELNLLPMKQQLEKAAGDAIARILTSSIHHDIMTGSRPRWKKALKFWTPIERTTKQGRTNCWLPEAGVEPEIRYPYMVPPWRIPPDIHIASSANDAIRAHDINALCRDNGVLDIFTDSSAIDGQVGASAVIPKLQQGRLCYMGTECMTTVFEAELQGLAMATSLALEVKESQN